MSEALAIGVDLGGTKIAFALVNRAGQVLARHRLDTLPEQGTDAVIARIADGIRQVQQQTTQSIAGVGMGTPGFVDSKNGIARKAVNLGWENVPVVARLCQQLDDALPIFIDNDVRALALGEMRYGVARGYESFVYLALGTGLGAALMVNGQMVSGTNHMAMEIGHTAVVPGGRLCTCGQRGCIEMYLSGKGLLASWTEYRATYPDSPLGQMETATTQDIINAMKAGDPLADAISDELANHLALVMGWCMGIVDPGLFVLGGGLGHAVTPLILDRVRERLRTYTLLPPNEHPSIAISTVTETAVGAASLVWQAQQD